MESTNTVCIFLYTMRLETKYIMKGFKKRGCCNKIASLCNLLCKRIIFGFIPKVSCSPRGLTVWVKDMAYLCSHSGQILTVNIQMNGWLHMGNLICPTCLDFCNFCPPEQDPPPVANLTRVVPIGK